MTATGSSARFGEQLTWNPERPRLRLRGLVVSWLVSALALMAAAAIVPGASIEGFWGALLVAAVVGVLNALRPAPDRGATAAVHARPRVPPRSLRRRGHAADRRLAHRGRDQARLVLGRAASGAPRLGGKRRHRRDDRRQRRYVHDRRDPAPGEAIRREGRDRRAGDRLPRDRRPRPPRPQARDARRQRIRRWPAG